MILYKLLIKRLNVSSLLAISGMLLGATLTSPTWAMDKDEKKIIPQAPLMAPFSVADVINHAASSPKNYEMEYLKSDSGQKHIEAVINDINKGQWPKKDNVKEAWNQGNLNTGYNKSLIGDHVSREYSRSLPPPFIAEPLASEYLVNTCRFKGLVANGTLQKMKIIYPASAFAEKIIFITDSGGEKYVIKVFQELLYYKQEKEELKKAISLKIWLVT